MIAQPSAGASPSGPSAPAPVTQVVVPDWGNQVSLFQTKQPAFWLYVSVLAICAILLAGQEFTYLRYSPIAFVVGVILLALFAVPIFLLIGVLDLFEREPLSLMVGAFLWGAIAVFPLALATNNAIIELWVKLFGPGLGIGWLVAIIPPPVEEILKFLGVVTIFLIARSEFDDVLDGFVYGALVGLGFQITEDMFYFFTHFIGPAQGANEIGALIEGYWIRVISSGLYSHPLYSALGGMGLAYWATRLDQPLQRRRLFLVGGLGLGILLHVFWNAPVLNFLLGDNPGPINWLLYSSIKGIPLLIFIGILVRLATRREQSYFQAVLGPQVGLDVVTPDEMRGLSDLRTRFMVRRAMSARKGPIAGRLLARIQREQLRYAMIATQTVDNRATLLAAQAELIRTLRNDLNAMPDVPRVAVAMPNPAGVQPTTVVAPGSGPSWPGGAQAQPGAGWPAGAQPGGPGAAPGVPAWQPTAATAASTPAWQPSPTQPTPTTAAPAQPSVGQPTTTPTPVERATSAQPTAVQPVPSNQSTAAAQPVPGWPTQVAPETQSGAGLAGQPAQPSTPPGQSGPGVTAAGSPEPTAADPSTSTGTVTPGPETSAQPPTASQPAPAQPATPSDPTAQTAAGTQPGTWQPTTQQPTPQQPAGTQPGQWQQQASGVQPTTGAQSGAWQPAMQQPGQQPAGGTQPGQWQQPASQQPAGWQQPGAQPAWRPAAPVAPTGPAGWAPTHRAAAPGQQSWDQPDPSRPMTPLAGNLDLQVVQRVGDWARVVAVNGWSGWVDARLLTPR